jgi:hypothetical protein
VKISKTRWDLSFIFTDKLIISENKQGLYLSVGVKICLIEPNFFLASLVKGEVMSDA